MKSQSLFVKTLHAIVTALLILNSIVPPILAAASTPPLVEQSEPTIAPPADEAVNQEATSTFTEWIAAIEDTSSSRIEQRGVVPSPAQQMRGLMAPQPWLGGQTSNILARQRTQTSEYLSQQFSSLADERQVGYNSQPNLLTPSQSPAFDREYVATPEPTFGPSDDQPSTITQPSLSTPKRVPLYSHTIVHNIYLPMVMNNFTDIPQETAITPAAGGTLTSADGRVTITFPPGAVNTPTTIRFDNNSIKGIPNFVSANQFFELTASDGGGNPVSQFSTDFSLTVSYDEGPHLIENNLALYFFDGNTWQQIPSSVDAGANQVSASLNHFTEFAALMPTTINWVVGTDVPLCQGTTIHHGPNLAEHTVVPEDDWLVRVTDGPRVVGGEVWWDTNRQILDNLPTSGTGWVSQTQAEEACLGNGEEVPPEDENGLAPFDALLRQTLFQMGWSVGQVEAFLAGDPVSPPTGNFVHQTTDWNIPGMGGFDFSLQRTYNAQDEQEGLFGYGWSTWLDMELRLANDGTIDVRYPDGHWAYFMTVGGDSYEPAQDGVFDTLTFDSSTGFRLTTPAQMSYLFDDGGQLIGLEERHGSQIILERNGDQISKIIDNALREFPVTYNGDFIASISDPTGRTIHYGYNGSDLVSVTDGRGGGTHQMGYSDHLMTNLTDPAGILYLQNVYNGEKQVIEQFDASGSSSTFNYDTAGLTIFTDNLGNQIRFSYDDQFRVTQRQDALGQSEQFGYEEYNLTNYTDKKGHSWSYSYDERGNLLSETDPLGFTSSYGYNDSNDLTSLTDQGGPGNSSRTTTFVYNGFGDLTQINQPDGSHIAATYEDHGAILTLTDENGHTTHYDYDGQGNLSQVTDPLGHLTQYGYDGVGRLTGMTDANGHTVQFAYDGNDNITQIIDPKGQSVDFQYDPNDSLTQLTDRRGGITTYSYDENLKLTSETDPEGHTTTYDYDAMYNRLSMTDPLGNTTLYRYDAIYQLTEIEDALGGITTFGYDPNGNVSQITDALGQVTTFGYDPLNRLETVMDALAGVTGYTFDAVGHLTQETNPRGAVTGYEYDLLDRLTGVQDALNGVWGFAYDPAGNLTTVTDANGHQTGLGYDAANRLTQRSDGAGHTTLFGYDGVGNLISMSDALGRVTGYGYDANDNLATITDALGGVTNLAYDAEDNLTSLTDANGHTTTFAYDLDGLLTHLTEAGGQVTVYAYDSGHNLTGLTNAKGNSWTYTYDDLNRRTSETDPLANVTGFGYDALSRMTRLTDANGIITRYDYDALDRLVGVAQNESAQPADHQTNVTTSYQYDPVGNLTAITDANGHATSFSYDLLDRLSEEINPLGDDWQYGYDPVGNLTSRLDANGQTTTYSYDADDMLTAISYPAGSSVTFGYDAVHNQTSMNDSLGLTQNSYDALNRLVSSSNHLGQPVSYGYDAVGNRTSLTYPDGSVMQYLYDVTDFVEQVIDPNGNTFVVTRDATHNITHLFNPNGTVAEYDLDAAERLTAVRNLQDNGNVLATFAYTLDPVGNRLETVAAFAAGKPTDLTTTYQYDPLYRLTRSDDSEGNFTDYGYDAVGNRLQLTTNYDPTIDRNIDQTTTTYSYNDANQLLTILQDVQPRPNNLKRGPQTARPLHAFVHQVEAQNGKHIDPTTATNLLDQANALIIALEGNPPPDESSVATDLAALQSTVDTAGAGGQIDNGGIVNSLSVKLNRAGQANTSSGGELLTSLYEYDFNGNRIRRTSPIDGTGNANDWTKTEYGYDVENRLTLVQDFRDPGTGNWLPGDETQLTYDGYGRLFQRLHDQHQGGGGQSWVDYVYDGLAPIVEEPSTGGQPINYYRGLGRILSMQDGPGTGNTNYYHHDGLGSVTMMTKHNNGNSAHDYRYHDYGLILDNNGHATDASNFTNPHNHYTYTGQEWDENTELLHFYAREYDPAVGVWLQQDPYRGRLAEPGTLHRYGYVGGNPIIHVDLYGYLDVSAECNTKECKVKAIESGNLGEVGGCTGGFVKRCGKITGPSAEIGAEAGVDVQNVNVDFGTYGKVDAYNLKGDIIVGNEIISKSIGGSHTGPDLSGMIGIKDNTLGAEIGASLLSAELHDGWNILGIYVGEKVEFRLGVKFGFKVGQQRTEIDAGPVSVGIVIDDTTENQYKNDHLPSRAHDVVEVYINDNITSTRFSGPNNRKGFYMGFPTRKVMLQREETVSGVRSGANEDVLSASFDNGAIIQGIESGEITEGSHLGDSGTSTTIEQKDNNEYVVTVLPTF